jgi:hypothetical protein
MKQVFIISFMVLSLTTYGQNKYNDSNFIKPTEYVVGTENVIASIKHWEKTINIKTINLLFVNSKNIETKQVEFPNDAKVYEIEQIKTDSLGIKIRKSDSFIKSLHIGMGIGPETLLSLFMPKVSLYNFQEHKIIDTYYGIEGTIGFLVAQWYSFDCLYGVKKNIFTLDTSIGTMWYPKQKFDSDPVGPYFNLTMNPKIGIRLRKLWLKAGPSLFLYKDYPKNQEELGMMTFSKIGNMHFNFEILVNFK